MASKRKNSLVNNINRRKRAGKSRPKSRSTVSKQAYEQMQKGWPQSSKTQRASKQKSSQSKSAKKKSTRKTARTKSGGARKTARKK